MAFPSAPGWGNLPNGNFSPVIYSKKVQLAFRKKAICMDVTNSDYFGEIASQGDTVRIIKEPEISVSRVCSVVLPLLRKTLMTLTSHSWLTKLTTLHSKWMTSKKPTATSTLLIWLPTVRLTAWLTSLDQEVSRLLCQATSSLLLHTNSDTVNDTVSGTVADVNAGTDELLATMKLNKGSFGNITAGGDNSIPVAARLPGATTLPDEYASPVMVINRMGRLLDQQNVDKDGRWCIIDPVMLEVLMDEDSRFLNADFGETGALRNGLVLSKWNGFRVYVSNNLPSVGTGPATTGTADQNANYGVIVAGHDSAVATAEQINKTETYRDPDSFADIVRGMHLYGRKILRPEALVNAKYNLA